MAKNTINQVLIPLGLKQCSRCKEVKSLDEFYKRNDRKSGWHSLCATCHNAIKSNPEIRKKQGKQYYQKNRERKRQWQREYYEQNRDDRRRYNSLYRQRNVEKLRRSSREYYRDNPDKIKRNNLRRKMRKLLIPYREIPNLENELYEIQNGLCLYCNTPLVKGPRSIHLDHIIPLSYAETLGSRYPGHVPSNLALTCHSCNLSKFDYILEDWVAWKFPEQMDEILHRVESYIKKVKDRWP